MPLPSGTGTGGHILLPSGTGIGVSLPLHPGTPLWSLLSEATGALFSSTAYSTSCKKKKSHVL
jgi:hypothetical protein